MKLIQTLFLTAITLLVPVFIVATQPSIASAAKCGGVDTSILSCGGKKEAKNVEDTGIWHILLLVLNIMTGGVAILAVGGFVYGAILYSTAEDKAAQVSEAKQTIFNVVVGLVLFAFMYALLQFLIPGGIFQ